MGPEMWTQKDKLHSSPSQHQGPSSAGTNQPPLPTLQPHAQLLSQQPGLAQGSVTHSSTQPLTLHVWLNGHVVGYWGSPLQVARAQRSMSTMTAISTINMGPDKRLGAEGQQQISLPSPRGPLSLSTSVPSVLSSGYATAQCSSSAASTLAPDHVHQYHAWPLARTTSQQQLLHTTISTHTSHLPPSMPHSSSLSLPPASGTLPAGNTRSSGLGPAAALATTATKDATHPHAPTARNETLGPHRDTAGGPTSAPSDTQSAHVAAAQSSAAGRPEVQPAGLAASSVMGATSCTTVLSRALTWNERPAADPALCWWSGELELPHGLELLLPMSR